MFFSIQVDTFAPTSKPMAAKPRLRRSRSNAMTAIAATAPSSEATETTSRTLSTKSLTGGWVRMAPSSEASPRRRPAVVRTVSW
jgi:hypothetical protein